MILVAMETILVGNYEFFNYQNVCIYKLGWCSVNTLASVEWSIIGKGRSPAFSSGVWDLYSCYIKKRYGPACDNIHIKFQIYYIFSLIDQLSD